jgi:hypothetical protein
MEFTLTDAEAWAIVSKPPQRPLYQHIDTFVGWAKPRRQWFLRVSHEPSGCWIWHGKCVTVRGKRFPVFEYEKGGPRISAFWWMLREWFPQFEDRDDGPRHSYPTCGDSQCISPVHRKVIKPIHRTKLTPDLVLAIYRQKGETPRTSTSVEFGISESTVTRIWHGRLWNDVTGHKQ